MPVSKHDKAEELICKELIENVYEIGTELGRGKFAVVKKCTEKSTGKFYAAKYLKKRRRAGNCREDAMKEIDIMRQAKAQPYIIQMHEVFETQREMIIILELAAGGELFRRVAQEPLSEEDARFIVRQIVNGTLYLHNKEIVHMDLKPENILLCAKESLDIKVADFGLAVQLQPGEILRNLVGTAEYVAPEILNYEAIGCASDMWSVGALTYSLMAGYSPFQGETHQETYLNVSMINYDYEDEVFATISDNAKDFIGKLLVKKPKDRLTSKECLAHPWLMEMEVSRPIKTHHESTMSVDSSISLSMDNVLSADNSPISSCTSSFAAGGQSSYDSSYPDERDIPEEGIKSSSYPEKLEMSSLLESITLPLDKTCTHSEKDLTESSKTDTSFDKLKPSLEKVKKMFEKENMYSTSPNSKLLAGTANLVTERNTKNKKDSAALSETLSSGREVKAHLPIESPQQPLEVTHSSLQSSQSTIKGFSPHSNQDKPKSEVTSSSSADSDRNMVASSSDVTEGPSSVANSLQMLTHGVSSSDLPTMSSPALMRTPLQIPGSGQAPEIHPRSMLVQDIPNQGSTTAYKKDEVILLPTSGGPVDNEHSRHSPSSHKDVPNSHRRHSPSSHKDVPDFHSRKVVNRTKRNHVHSRPDSFVIPMEVREAILKGDFDIIDESIYKQDSHGDCQ